MCYYVCVRESVKLCKCDFAKARRLPLTARMQHTCGFTSAKLMHKHQKKKYQNDLYHICFLFCPSKWIYYYVKLCMWKYKCALLH